MWFKVIELEVPWYPFYVLLDGRKSVTHTNDFGFKMMLSSHMWRQLSRVSGRKSFLLLFLSCPSFNKISVLYLYVWDESASPTGGAFRGLDPYSQMTFGAPERPKRLQSVCSKMLSFLMPSFAADCCSSRVNTAQAARQQEMPSKGNHAIFKLKMLLKSAWSLVKKMVWVNVKL